MSVIKKLFWQLFIAIDRKLKFPAIRHGDFAIQAGFDMSAPVTSDLFLLCRCVGKKGTVIGIDPDPENIRIALSIIKKNNWPVILIQKALFDHAGTTHLLLAAKASWNQLKLIPPDREILPTEKSVEVEMDTLDHIIAENNIPVQKIRHVNITVNGSEYKTLLGMENLLRTAENISITVIAGRNDVSGLIGNTPDYIAITGLLRKFGFITRFYRISDLFWWGFIVNRLMKRKKHSQQNNYGVVMAGKGNGVPRWYQSFS